MNRMLVFLSSCSGWLYPHVEREDAKSTRLGKFLPRVYVTALLSKVSELHRDVIQGGGIALRAAEHHRALDRCDGQRREAGRPAPDPRRSACRRAARMSCQAAKTSATARVSCGESSWASTATATTGHPALKSLLFRIRRQRLDEVQHRRHRVLGRGHALAVSSRRTRLRSARPPPRARPCRRGSGGRSIRAALRCARARRRGSYRSGPAHAAARVVLAIMRARLSLRFGVHYDGHHSRVRPDAPDHEDPQCRSWT